MKYPHILLLWLFSLSASGQMITYNHPVDSTHAETREVMTLFENYISSNPQNKTKNPFWNQADQQKHQNYDFLESEFQPSLYMGFPIHVLSMKFEGERCVIKAQFSYCNEDGTPYVLAIANYIAKREGKSFKLYNALTENKKNWLHTRVGWVDYYYPGYHTFDYERAHKLQDFVKEICENFDVEPKPFEYYFADDYDEVQRLKGLDYYIGMGGRSMPSGRATDDKVYCGGLGEYYTHEVFHVQMDEHFPNQHFWASEGVATWLGGSRGKTLDWHIKRTHEYLQKHPDLDLNHLLQLKNMDGQTSFHYVLGGLIAKNIWKKGGWKLIKEFMSSGISDDHYYAFIEKHLGIHQQQLNDYLRNELQIESTK